MSTASPYTTFSQIPQATTHRSYHALSPNESHITPATVGMFSAFRLVLAPPFHSFLDVQNWGRWERKPTSRCLRVNPFRTAVPFWGQRTQIPSSLSPKRDCGSKWVKVTCHTLTDLTTLGTVLFTHVVVTRRFVQEGKVHQMMRSGQKSMIDRSFMIVVSNWQLDNGKSLAAMPQEKTARKSHV